MTYATPELLLVGAAQNLVLGQVDTDDGRDCQFNITDNASDLLELW